MKKILFVLCCLALAGILAGGAATARAGGDKVRLVWTCSAIGKQPAESGAGEWTSYRYTLNQEMHMAAAANPHCRYMIEGEGKPQTASGKSEK